MAQNFVEKNRLPFSGPGRLHGERAWSKFAKYGGRVITPSVTGSPSSGRRRGPPQDFLGRRNVFLRVFKET